MKVVVRGLTKVYTTNQGDLRALGGINLEALANDPEVVLMDEPFANLDAQTRLVMREELLRIWERDKKTVILVTHNLEEAVMLCDRIAVMSSRPGLIKEVVTVDIPRPRTMKSMRDPDFSLCMEKIWNLLRYDVDAALQSNRV
jgi:NitT/TauT family transport system ATP-binding protein